MVPNLEVSTNFAVLCEKIGGMQEGERKAPFGAR